MATRDSCRELYGQVAERLRLRLQTCCRWVRLPSWLPNTVREQLDEQPSCLLGETGSIPVHTAKHESCACADH